MADLFLWWIFVSIIGMITFPIAFYFFSNFRTKGYVFAKILGLLVFGYVFWIGNLTGLLGNNWGGAFSSLLILVIISGIVLKNKISLPQILLWLRGNKRRVVFFELLIFALILLITFLRGTNPAIIGTEKPMELAFINAIVRSETFPPKDPWLSGYSISYYYFGYLIVAGIVKLLFTPTGIAFNLALIFWFALSGAGLSEICINLILDREIPAHQQSSKMEQRKANWFGVLAALFLLVISNAEGLLELMHSLGLFWQSAGGKLADSGFWQWIDIQELTQPPPLPFDWKLQRPGGTWWWRASRVLQDYTITGHSREIIDEFPFFSFLLGDLHPHVLAIPFVLLNIATGYSLLKKKVVVGKSIIGTTAEFWKEEKTWLFPLILGSLIFMNTWDFPVYFGLFSITIFIKFLHASYSFKLGLIRAAAIVSILAVFSISLFLPFLISFSSQAGGILPSLVYQSRSIHLLIMFFPFIIVILVDLISRKSQKAEKLVLLKVIIGSIASFIFLQAIVYFFSSIIVLAPHYLLNAESPGLQNWASARQMQAQNFLNIYNGTSIGEVLRVSVNRMLTDPVDIILLLICIAFGLKLAFPATLNSENSADHVGKLPEKYYGLIIIFTALLILIPEVVYLRDQFGWRMNTIFKFYYQVWILASIAVVYALSRGSGRIWKVIKRGFAIISIGAGLVYPVFALVERIETFDQERFSLDGNAYFAASNPSEQEAVQFLKDIPSGVIAEAIGGSYSNFARISKLTGMPTVLGWPGHELQWRGGSNEIDSREPDIKTLFSTEQWYAAEEIMDRYEIRYIFIGGLERSTYTVSEEKFDQNLTLIFMNEAVKIYENAKHAK